MRQIYATFMSLAQKLDKYENKPVTGLTARQYMVILAIRLSSHEETFMAGIAKKLCTTKQNINRLIHVLEKKGYVSRSVNGNSKRKVNIEITDSGLKAMLDYAETDVALMVDIFHGFSESDLESLWQLLQKIRCYGNTGLSCYLNEVNELFESDYSDLLAKILASYREIKATG